MDADSLAGGLAAIDEEVARRAIAVPQPPDVEPQLATFERDPGPGPWIYERKLDGVRILVHVRHGQVRLQSRNHQAYAAHFPELVGAVRDGTSHDLIADGEVVAHDGEATSFPLLQTRIGSPVKPGHHPRVAVHLYLFDLLYLDVHDLRPVPLLARKQLLERAFTFREPLRYTVHQHGDAQILLDDACARGWEGLVAKHPDAPYRPGRSTAWRKLPCLRTGAFVVGGFTPPRRSRAGFGALLLGYHDLDGHLRYAGKVGTGFDQAELAAIRSFLGRIEVVAPPFVDAPRERGTRWVEPLLIVEVDYTELTAAGRLRQPRFIGVLTDREPRDVQQPSAR